VDILICTPGRLMDHLNGTPNFSLQHLRFLVIDEADRLLAQSFQGWLTRVLSATRPPSHVESGAAQDEETPIPYPDGLSPAFLHLLRGVPAVQTDLDEKRESSCQKLLFSATLMSDPGRIGALELRKPHYIVVKSSSESHVLDVAMEKFSMPATLKVRVVSHLIAPFNYMLRRNT
jgi:ATP-dependent RNA helicase DDX51/DBP6